MWRNGTRSWKLKKETFNDTPGLLEPRACHCPGSETVIAAGSVGRYKRGEKQSLKCQLHMSIRGQRAAAGAGWLNWWAV